MEAIMSDIYPEANKIANEVIPGVYGSFRGYWIKGSVGMKVKVVRTSEAERFYKMGKEEQKKRRAKMKGEIMDKELAEVITNAPLFGVKRNPKNEFDFGDDATVGLRVKTGKNQDHEFGVYLGKYNDKFHVGTCRIMSFMPSKLESFNSLEDLKQKWQLD